MAKQPTLPLYYNDISRTCSTWTDEEFGCYLRLLIEQWDKGFIPKDVNRLKRLSTSVENNWPLIKGKFIEVDGVLKNENMEAIRLNLKKHKEKQKENIAKRYENKEPEPVKEKTKVAAESIESREEKFKETLRPLIGEHPKERITKFFNYWSERTTGGKKMRFELQKTWELNKRLATWAGNENKNSNSNGNKLKDNTPIWRR